LMYLGHNLPTNQNNSLYLLMLYGIISQNF
jgi:hypothetical protein